MDIFIELLIFSVSIFFLVKSADLFVGNAEKLGKSVGLPNFITGILVLAIGTSLPEFATSIVAMLENSPEIVIGNVLGSNIANVFLGMGLVIFLSRGSLHFEQNIFKVHTPIYIISMSAAVLMLLDGKIIFWEGFILMMIGFAYLWFLFETQKTSLLGNSEKFNWKYVFWVFISLVGIIIASETTVQSILKLSDLFGVGTTALSASLIAVGTSLPEMMVGVSAIRRKHYDMLMGNILGSNIFNIVLVLGGGSFLSHFIGVELTTNAITMKVLIPFAIASAFIFIGSGVDKEITKQEGLAMASVYLLFLGMLFGVV